MDWSRIEITKITLFTTLKITDKVSDYFNFYFSVYFGNYPEITAMYQNYNSSVINFSEFNDPAIITYFTVKYRDF